MPVITRFSAALDRAYEESPDNQPSSPPPFSGLDSAAHSTPNGSLSSRTNSVDSLDSSGSGSGSGHSRQVSNDSSSEHIPTRSVKQASKASHNPLHFVKVGTCDLYKKAEAQIKKAEEVKKLKSMTKQEPEDWQNNLDNWKSKRRQSAQKLVDRVEERHKLEEEEMGNRTRRKSKTFNEMMEDRSKRGLGARKLSYYSDELDDDNSLNGKSTNGYTDNGSPKMDTSLDSTESDHVFSNDDSSVDQSQNDDEPPQQPTSVHTNGLNGSSKTSPKSNGSVQQEIPTRTSPFDQAIQSYVQYAESQKKVSKKPVVSCEKVKPLWNTEDDDVDGIGRNGKSREQSPTPEEPTPQRTGGSELAVVVTIKPGSSDQRDFGFTTRGAGRGLVFVEHITPRGPAESAGLKINDEVLSINGEGASNRSHSAIVFAIKQAVYTGQLQLVIYRYDNATEAPNFKPAVTPTSAQKRSRVEERKAAFSKENSFEREITPEQRNKPFVREKSPKVDVLKRRSLFESPPRDNEVHPNWRSQDTSASNALKNRIASYENLDSPVDSKPQEERKNSATKVKSPPSKSNDAASIKPSERKAATNEFRKRLASFEQQDAADKVEDEKKSPTERKQSLKEKIANFERSEPFDRSPSCDAVADNVSSHHNGGNKFSATNPKPTRRNCYSDDKTATVLLPAETKHPLRKVPSTKPKETAVPSSPPPSNERSETDNWMDELDAIDNAGPPRIINVVTKTSSSPEPVPRRPLVSREHPPMFHEPPGMPPPQPLSPLDPVVVERPFTNSATHHPYDVFDAACEPPPSPPAIEEIIQKSTASPPNREKSSFELADSLEETPITNSQQNNHQTNNGEMDSDAMEQQILDQLEQEENKRSCEDEDDLPELERLNLSNLGEEVIIVDDFNFEAPPRVTEPPKEKPPPPPVDLDAANEHPPDSTSSKLKRVESTKRIHKEICRRRSEFLGIEPDNHHDYLDAEVSAPLPLSLESVLRTDKRAEAPVKQSLKKPNKAADANWKKNGSGNEETNGVDSPRGSVNQNHRANDEDDIARKEREIIENLEREEQQKKEKFYTNSRISEEEERIRRLEEERRQMERERHYREEERIRMEEEKKLREREEQLWRQEPLPPTSSGDALQLDLQQQELLRLEREKLRQEQEELRRQREEYQRQMQLHHQQMYTPHAGVPLQHSAQTSPVYGNCTEPVAAVMEPVLGPRTSKVESKPVGASKASPQSSPEVRDEVMKISRRPGSENHAKPEGRGEAPPHAEEGPTSKHTLYALSAAPKAKLNDGERLTAKRKPEAAQRRDPAAYNQHWLIQEAEMRRISDQQNRLHQQAKSMQPSREVLPENVHQPQQRRVPPPQPPPTSPPQLDKPYSRMTNPVSREQVPRRSSHDRRDYIELPQPAVAPPPPPPKNYSPTSNGGDSQMLSVSGKKKCSHCSEELGRGAAMIIESLQLFFHIHCFKCCVCHVQLGNGLTGADVRVRNQKLHCHNCYSNDEAGLKFSKV